MPPDPRRIAFAPVMPEHYPLLAAWLEAPHWREWWGDPVEELGFIRDMVEGRDTTRPFLILLDGRPVGYIQVWFVGHHQNEGWTKDHPWLAALPARAVGVDLSIGAEGDLSRGIGSAALGAFVARLRAEGHDTIIIDPDPANARAVRAYGKAGFRPIPALLGRTGEGVLILQHDPKANEIS
ncbi:GNAT family N-acetyltransferase [Ensifer soli]|uniref:GNAT family N-acetyltransferase n=1 Tax=Ciceribacter sp. sgz301302 TaxID=3342379 RepID=UPI0035B9F117